MGSAVCVPLLWWLPGERELGCLRCSLLQVPYHRPSWRAPHQEERGDRAGHPLARVIKHPRYSSYNINNDIMLIKLSTPATLTPEVQPVALPSSCAAAGTMCRVAGWGNTMGTGDSNKLQCPNPPILSDEDCDNSYPGMITDAMFCAG